ncbi:hypothetical protein [Catenibacterium sp.]
MHLQESLQNYARTDIRYMFIAQNQEAATHQAFQRFIHDDLIMSC